ncbi:MAG: glycogen debranching protein GlgX [Anaerolineae bacterium]|nr:glycogen debranching protein GlgX [Anaerolineae bacterium]
MSKLVLPGKSFPLGATVLPDGINFCVFSKNCTDLELLLYDSPTAPQPSRVIRLDPQMNRTFYYWHAFLPGLLPGQVYAYRASGPFAPERGHRFDGHKVLLDPYARAVANAQNYQREAARRPGDNSPYALRGVAVDTAAYDWEGDAPLPRPNRRRVIYEMHVDAFTRHPNSGVSPQRRGTFAGVIEKIPYLQSLGINAVELLPVQHFDDQDAPSGHRNYWGYTPIAFFAPHSTYSADPNPLGIVNEFRDMVKALHRAGIEVILDVVFNHTAEGDHRGPTLSFRGLENRAYYILEPDQGYYSNFSGCGNTLNTNQSIVRRFIIDCLRYWVAEMHVDGFRFDLASVMARDEWGHPLKSPPILWEIESDPILAGTEIIAEAWDAVGLYQVGSFIGHRWAEWNGKFRDDLRRFVKSDGGMTGVLAARLVGSPDLYPHPSREAQRSINFVTCHDGFTLNDLVSYNQKHNEANGENNRDGNDCNFSWNCGVEGPTEDKSIETLRVRQIKNLLTFLFFSQGTPMLLMGDEVRRTQKGNNNTYAQNNDLNWFDWTGVERHAEILRFTQKVIALTAAHDIFQEPRSWANPEGHTKPWITWHGVRLNQPDWGGESRTLAAWLIHPPSKVQYYFIFNAYWEVLNFELPSLPGGGRWRRLIDTAQPPPDDISAVESAPMHKSNHYRVEGRSVVILIGDMHEGTGRKATQ